MGGLVELFVILAILVGGAIVVAGLVYLLVSVFRALGVVIGRFFTFIGHTIRDLARAVGAVIAAVVISLLCVGNIIIGRWSAAAHFGRAVRSEFHTCLACMYRFLVANPLHLFGLEGVTEGLERRLPQVVADAPAPEPSRSARAKFEGYTIVGTLAAGGSGARLYIADPDTMKRAAFERAGLANVGQVVIKAFALDDGSSLPQIVRESRALDAARRLGLILDHELTPQRFYYVMRYVPGESLSHVTKRLHAMTGPDGLGPREVRNALSYTADLLATLAAYHRGGLWHKDVKPDNIIVDTRPGGTGRAYLVDFGLLGSLKSAMTLTTHGTEYFRDPELVRLAVKGVKVHEVDGTRFDVYGVGAVLFSMIEDGFPPHGGLSQVTRKCPDAVRWIIRRAMADYDKRYSGAEEMLADVRAALSAEDPYSVKPIDLPSVRGGPAPIAGVVPPANAAANVAASEARGGPINSIAHAVAAGAAAFAHAVTPHGANASARSAHAQPKVQVLNWWTGRSRTEHPTADAATPAAIAAVAQQEWIEQRIHQASLAPGVPLQQSAFSPDLSGIRHGATRRSAQAQLAAARERVENARARAQQRAQRLRAPARQADTGPNVGVGIAIVVVAGLAVGAYSLTPVRRASTGAAATVVQLPTVDERTVSLGPGGSLVLMSDPTAPVRDVSDMPATATLDGDASRVLIVVDALPPVPAALSAAAARVASSLSAAGAEIVGMGGGDSDEIEWLASARAAMGASPADNADAPERIRAFFEAHEDAAAIVWMSATQEAQGAEHAGNEHVNAHVFVSDQATNDDAQTLGVLISRAMQ